MWGLYILPTSLSAFMTWCMFVINLFCQKFDITPLLTSLHTVEIAKNILLKHYDNKIGTKTFPRPIFNKVSTSNSEISSRSILYGKLDVPFGLTCTLMLPSLGIQPLTHTTTNVYSHLFQCKRHCVAHCLRIKPKFNSNLNIKVLRFKLDRVLAAKRKLAFTSTVEKPVFRGKFRKWNPNVYIGQVSFTAVCVVFVRVWFDFWVWQVQNNFAALCVRNTPAGRIRWHVPARERFCSFFSVLKFDFLFEMWRLNELWPIVPVL